MMGVLSTKLTQYETQLESDLLESVALHWGRLMNCLADRPSQGLYLGAVLVSHMTIQGHICLDLSGIAGGPFLDVYGNTICHCPPLEAWHKDLLESGVVGRPGDFAPLILDGHGRLYLYRYWQYETSLAAALLERANKPLIRHDTALLRTLFAKYFPSYNNLDEFDWQALASFLSLAKRLCIISGGPGTGKTSTVCKILALNLELNPSCPPRIALAAPTGKAAARLEQAIKELRTEISISSELREKIPTEAATIHRLLGSSPSSSYFSHNRDNPLPADMVVVDEASMVDLPLMAKLFDALKPEAQVLMLGDKDQLASVEAGAVLGDICADKTVSTFSRDLIGAAQELFPGSKGALVQGPESTGLCDCVVLLRKNYRFGHRSGIGSLAQAVNSGDADAALDILRDSSLCDVAWYELPSPPALTQKLADTVIGGYTGLFESKELADKLQCLDGYRILCAVRHGPYGLLSLNRVVEQILERNGLIRPFSEIYPGLPLLVTRNDYDLGVFNGDLGIVTGPHGFSGNVSVIFQDPDGSIKIIHPSRLPAYDVAYAMSIHKAQGSEFDKVSIVLPDRDVPILTRELLYTGITRARECVQIWATEEILRKAITRRIQRSSGLREALL